MQMYIKLSMWQSWIGLKIILWTYTRQNSECILELRCHFSTIYYYYLYKMSIYQVTTTIKSLTTKLNVCCTHQSKWDDNIYIVKAPVLLKSSNHYFKMIWVLDSHILLIVIKALIFLLMPLKRHMFEVYPP